MPRRLACVRQADQSDCGPAALATVALHHGVRVGREKLREVAGTDRVGTTLLGMVQAGERLGFAARAVKGTYEALAAAPLPAIAHVRTERGTGHYVVLHRITAKRVVLADPGRGIVTQTRAEFTATWTGNVLLLVPRRDLSARGAEVTSPSRRFLRLLLQYRPLLVEAFGCALLLTGLGIVSSYFLQHLVDSVLVRGDHALLRAFGIGMLGILAFKTLFGAVRQYLLAHVARRAALTLVAGYVRHVIHLPLGFYEARRTGEILSRVQDAAKVRDAISGVTLTAVVDGTLVVITLAVLWSYDTQLALVTSLFVPVLIASVLAGHPAARRRSRHAMEKSAELSAHLNEDIAGVETIKALGHERARLEAGESRLVAVVQSGFALQKLGIGTGALAGAVTGAAGVVVLWFGGERVIDGAMTIGQLMFFNSLLGYLLGPLERLASVNLQIQDALVAVDRLYQVMDLDLEQPADARRAALGQVTRGLELRDVTFRYGTRGNVLEHVDLEIPAGKTVAIVGESGSGKTTLLKLLMRFYDPSEGQLLFDGVDARDLDTASVRARIGLVSQEPFIFTGTLRENLAIARPDAPLDDLLRAAVAAGLGDVIQRLPQRLETVIGERGANLSGGQRQRLAIARALLACPDVLIFDEATSHLDTATERAIQATLQTALAGKTVVLVAHRLSTVRHADIIYVLAGGKVAERGTHDELLGKGGAYAALVRAQLDGAEPVAPRPAAIAARPALAPVPAAAPPAPTTIAAALAANPAATQRMFAVTPLRQPAQLRAVVAAGEAFAEAEVTAVWTAPEVRHGR